MIAAQGRKVAALEAHKTGADAAALPPRRRNPPPPPLPRVPRRGGVGGRSRTRQAFAVSGAARRADPNSYMRRKVTRSHAEGQTKNCDKLIIDGRSIASRQPCDRSTTLFPSGEAALTQSLPNDILVARLAWRIDAQGRRLHFSTGARLLRDEYGLDRNRGRFIQSRTIRASRHQRVRKFFSALPPPSSSGSPRVYPRWTVLSAASRKVEALKQHKKGLMQQLFPSGEGSA